MAEDGSWGALDGGGNCGWEEWCWHDSLWYEEFLNANTDARNKVEGWKW